MRGIFGLKKLGVLVALSLMAASAAKAADVTRFNANGNYATHNSFDGAMSLDLGVFKNDQGKSATTNMYYIQQACDANACSGTFGNGAIPNGDFIAGGGTAKLNTNLGANAGFQCFSFIMDYTNGYSQTPIPCGTVDIDWKKIPRQSSSQMTNSTNVNGAFSTHQVGQQDFDRANATGTFFGAPIPPSSNSIIGVNKSHVMEIRR